MAFLSRVHSSYPVDTVNSVQTLKAGALQTTLYVEVLVWSFYNTKSGEAFANLMQEITHEGLEGEGYFNVYPLPDYVENEHVPVELRQGYGGNVYVPSGGTEFVLSLCHCVNPRVSMNMLACWQSIRRQLL
jgi:hypothetical protein